MNISAAADLQKLETELSEVKKTDAGKAYDEAKKAKQTLADLEAKQKDLQNDLVALRAQKVHAEHAKKKMEGDLRDAQKDMQGLRGQNTTLQNQESQHKKDVDKLKGDVAQRDVEMAKRKKELADLQTHYNVARQKALEVQRLEKEVSRLKDAGKFQPEVQKLQSQLGPVNPKYKRRGKDAHGQDLDVELPGAIDLKETDPTLAKEWIEYAKEYRKRYFIPALKPGETDDHQGSHGPAAIMEASFLYSFNQLIEMAAAGDKIKLNISDETYCSSGACTVYRYMVYDLLRGAKVVDDLCAGFKLRINHNVEMLPSRPENILQFKPDSKGGYQPTVIVRYKQRDDFTPGEATLQGKGVKYGVDPVSARWILEQLSEEEEEHLLNLLLAPVIENDHPEYVKTKDFMRKTHDPRVQLVQTAFELMDDMSTAYQDKFASVFANLWPKCANEDIPAFEKAEDVKPDMTKIKDDVVINVDSSTTVDWEIDMDVIGDKTAGKAKNPHFIDLVTFTKVKYDSFFKTLDDQLLAHPAVEGTRYQQVQFDVGSPSFNKQYYIAHQMIGADANFNGGQRCLFSNLLAIMVSDPHDLTVDNVLAMRRAMAAYLDKLQKAKAEWAKIKDLSTKPKDADKLKELADLAKAFETGILKTHKCNVFQYQLWLRNEPQGWNGSTWVAMPTSIDISNLTPFEIELCAWTFGVKIGLQGIKDSKNQVTCPAIVDEYGRIVPEAEYYGPNTKEHLLMLCNNGSFYGAFPKLQAQIIKGMDINDEKISKIS